jgi:hypothetical protein
MEDLPKSLENLHITELTPLSPEVIERQATINIGLSARRVFNFLKVPLDM